jgi:hypothetical protein
MIFRVKKFYFHYDFAYKKVPLSLRYTKKHMIYFELLLFLYNVTAQGRSIRLQSNEKQKAFTNELKGKK